MNAMHDRLTTVLPLLLLTLSLCAAVPVHATDSFEPNDNFEQAKAVKLNEVFESSINPVKDVDWFTTTITKAGYVRVTIDNKAAAPVDPVVQLLTGKGRKIGDLEARVKPGPLYIAISEYNNDEAHAGMLKITVQFWEEADATEVNNDFAHARTVKPGDTVDFALMPAGDADMFALSVPQTGFLHVVVDNSAAKEVDPVLEIFNSKRQKLGAGEARVSGGQIFVRVSEYLNDESSPNPLKATFQFTAESDASEPNHGFTRARDAAFGTAVPFAIMPVGDQDMFRLKIAETGYLRVAIDNSKAAEIDPVVAIYDAGQVSLGAMEARVSAGDIYVNISERGNNGSSPNNLAATFSFLAETDKTEPNDSIALAREVKPGDSADFAIMPVGDHDTFRLKIAETGYLRVAIDNSKAAEIDPVVAIYDAGQVSLGAMEARVSAGDIYVNISERGNNGSSPNNLAATFSFLAETDKTEPNDSIALAREVKLGDSVDFAIMPLGDREVFKLSLDKPGDLQVTVDQTAASELDLAYFIYDQRGQRIGERNAFVRPGTVYVWIEEQQHNASSPEMLKATFTFTAAAADDPRLTIADDALAAEIGKDSVIGFSKEQSRQVFRVVSPSAGKLSGLLKWTTPEPPKVLLELYDEQLNYLGSTASGSAAAPKGTIHVVATVNPDRVGEASNGTITFAHDAGNDMHEPNLHFAAAHKVKLNETVEFTLFPKGDRDFFYGQIEKPGYLAVTIDKSVASHLDPWSVIYDESQRQVGKYSARVRPGDFFVQIGDSYDDELSDKPIKATFQFVAETDTSEPNNSGHTARTVKSGSTVDFMLMPMGDRDYFSLDCPTAGYLQIAIDKSAPGAGHLDPFAVIYDHNFRKLADNAARVPKGKVYVEIGDSYDDEWSTQQLKVSFTLTPDPDKGEPDDRFPLARTIAPGEPADVYLMPDTDQDCYKFEVPGPGSVQVRLDNTRATNLRPWAQIFNRHQEKIGDLGARVEAGTVYIRIGNSARRQITTNPVRATAIYLPDNPAPELIRRPGDGIEVKLTTEGSIFTSPIRSTAPGFFSVNALFPPTAIEQLTVELISPNGEVIAAAGPRLYPPGIYHVIAHARKGQSKSPFALRVDAVEPVDIYEPNDTETEATESRLPFHGWVCLHNAPHADHFRFNVDTEGLYQIRIDHPTLNPQVRFAIWPVDDKSDAASIPTVYHTGSGYSALYARLDVRQYHLVLTGSATADGNANPVKLSITALNRGDIPPGDLLIMAFGMPEDSPGFKAITNLSKMVATPLRSGEKAEDIAKELRDTVSNANVPDNQPSQQPGDNSTASSTPKPVATATEKTPNASVPTAGTGIWRKLLGATLLVIAIAGAFMIMRKTIASAL